MGHSSIGVGGSRDGGSNPRGVVGNHRDSSDTGDDSTVGQTSSHLANGVGAGLSLPLAIVDTVVKSRDGSGIVHGRGGTADRWRQRVCVRCRDQRQRRSGLPR